MTDATTVSPATSIGTPALRLTDVKKRYGAIEALSGVSFEIPQGVVCGLLGPNGAGKSTLMQIITTLLRQDEGQVECFGFDTQGDPRKVREQLGYVAQQIALDKALTGKEHLSLHGALYHVPRSELTSRIADVLDLVGLTDVAHRRVSTYSGGMARRLDLATALLHGPRLLILDEPTVGLDIHTRSALWRFIRRLADEGTAVLIASHHTEEIEYLADTIVILDHGKVLASGTSADLKDAFASTLVHIKTQAYADAEELGHLADRLAGNAHADRVLVDESDGGRVIIGLHQRVVDTEALRSSFAATLSIEPQSFFSFSIQQPTLDDVFLSATGHALRDAAWRQTDTPPASRRKPVNA